MSPPAVSVLMSVIAAVLRMRGIDWRRVSPAARDWVIVAGVFAVLVGVAAVWLSTDRLPSQWDHANHLERVVTCAGDLARGDAQRVLERSSFYPPFVPCVAALVYRLWPTDEAASQAVILLFLGLGMGATYLLGRRFSGGAAGVVAATAFGTAPFVVYISLRFQLDLPLAAMVALAIEALLRTEDFRRLNWSLAAGIVVGLGLLTKPTFLVYVLVPTVWLAVQIADRRRLANAALGRRVGSSPSTHGASGSSGPESVPPIFVNSCATLKGPGGPR